MREARSGPVGPDTRAALTVNGCPVGVSRGAENCDCDSALHPRPAPGALRRARGHRAMNGAVLIWRIREGLTRPDVHGMGGYVLVRASWGRVLSGRRVAWCVKTVNVNEGLACP